MKHVVFKQFMLSMGILCNNETCCNNKHICETDTELVQAAALTLSDVCTAEHNYVECRCSSNHDIETASIT